MREGIAFLICMHAFMHTNINVQVHTRTTRTHTCTRKHAHTHTGQAHVPPDLIGQCLVQFADKDAAIRAAQVVCTLGELEESEKNRAREQL